MIADMRTLTALVRLRNDAGFRDVLAFLREREKRNTCCAVQERDEIMLRRAQGAALELGEFLQLCESAPAIYEQRRINGQDARTESII